MRTAVYGKTWWGEQWLQARPAAPAVRQRPREGQVQGISACWRALTLAVERSAAPPQPPVPLATPLADAKWAQARYAILQQVSVLAEFFAPLAARVRAGAAAPIGIAHGDLPALLFDTLDAPSASRPRWQSGTGERWIGKLPPEELKAVRAGVSRCDNVAYQRTRFSSVRLYSWNGLPGGASSNVSTKWSSPMNSYVSRAFHALLRFSKRSLSNTSFAAPGSEAWR